MQPTTFRARKIGKIETHWRAVFDDYWPVYKAWYTEKKGDDVSPQALKSAHRQLASIMPEMLPLYETLLEAGNDCPVAAQFLTGYQPPAYLVNCSQAILLDEEPLLIRNYDLSPDMSENLLTHSDWLGQEIIGSNECLWGLDDGMNKSGLATSITFGGSKQVGNGFGIPFVMRYMLQICDNVRQAIKLLQRVPSHMAYNVTLVDRHGDFATVMLAPGRSATVTRERCITNHQGRVTWPEQAVFSNTIERKRFLDNLLARANVSEQQLREAFLTKPLRSANYLHNFGTVFTATYKPLSEQMSYHWPAERVWQHGFSDFAASERVVNLAQQARSAKIHADTIEHASPGIGISENIRKQLLQGLMFLPGTMVGQPQALQKLKQDLRGECSFSWQDYAEQIARVWSYSAPAT